MLAIRRRLGTEKGEALELDDRVEERVGEVVGDGGDLAGEHDREEHRLAGDLHEDDGTVRCSREMPPKKAAEP